MNDEEGRNGTSSAEDKSVDESLSLGFGRVISDGKGFGERLMGRKKVGDRPAEGSPPLRAAKAPGGKNVDHVKVFAERLRDQKDLESRWAILHESRVEYFRGKDFAAFIRKHPDLADSLKEEIACDVDAEIIGNILLKRKLIVRCDRVVNVVRPGKKKLSKWPARIALYNVQSFSEDDAFFAWAFERRRPLWQTVLSFLVPVVTIACCLFPIFPHWCKLGVLYFCLTFLTIIFGLLFLRGAIFGVMWLLFGWRIWFFPNLLAEEATFAEIFHFWPEKKKDNDQPPKRTTRLAFALLTVASIWVLVHHAPDEAARLRYRRKVSNIIDEVVVWKPNLAALSGKSAEDVVVGDAESFHNVTEDGNTRSSESAEDVEVGDTESPHNVPEDGGTPDAEQAEAVEI